MEPTAETEQALNQLLSYGDTEAAIALVTMGDRAKEIVPECVGLSLAMLEDGLTFTLVATSDEIAMLDAVQYIDGGPCVEDLERQVTIDVNEADLLDEDRWRMFAQASAAAGVASSLSLPILRDGRAIAGVNLYAATANAFHGRHEELAEALGASVEGAVANADLAFSTRQKAAETPALLADQNDINIAVGIIAVSQDVDVRTAHERLEEAAARAGITPGQAARALRHIRTS